MVFLLLLCGTFFFGFVYNCAHRRHLLLLSLFFFFFSSPSSTHSLSLPHQRESKRPPSFLPPDRCRSTGLFFLPSLFPSCLSFPSLFPLFLLVFVARSKLCQVMLEMCAETHRRRRRRRRGRRPPGEEEEEEETAEAVADQTSKKACLQQQKIEESMLFSPGTNFSASRSALSACVPFLCCGGPLGEY